MPVSPWKRSSSSDKETPRNSRLRSALAGWILGILGGVTVARLNLNLPRGFLPPPVLVPALGFIGMALGFVRLQALVWLASGLLSLFYCFIAYTPFMESRVAGYIRADPPAKCAAVVMLSADVWSDGTLSQNAQDRLLTTLELLKAGYAPALVVTRVAPPHPSGLGEVRRRMKLADLNVPVYEVGPTRDTHDEALRVSGLARQHGWKEILLVTSPLHTSRAGATFEKTGLRVRVRPSQESEYDLKDLSGPGDRVNAFRDWIREAVGWNAYRGRGWI